MGLYSTNSISGSSRTHSRNKKFKLKTKFKLKADVGPHQRTREGGAPLTRYPPTLKKKRVGGF
jgi:hypothetical protein